MKLSYRVFLYIGVSCGGWGKCNSSIQSMTCCNKSYKTLVPVTGWGYSLLAIPSSIIVRGLNFDIISPAFKLISQIIIKN